MTSRLPRPGGCRQTLSAVAGKDDGRRGRSIPPCRRGRSFPSETPSTQTAFAHLFLSSLQNPHFREVHSRAYRSARIVDLRTVVLRPETNSSMRSNLGALATAGASKLEMPDYPLEPSMQSARQGRPEQRQRSGRGGRCERSASAGYIEDRRRLPQPIVELK